MNDVVQLPLMTEDKDKVFSVSVDEVAFVKELYIRFKPTDAQIEQYRASLGLHPPITLARGRILVDGYHRWQAHRREGLTEIPAIDLGNLSDLEILKESWLRNKAHGLAPSTAERKAGCDGLYRKGMKDYSEIAFHIGVTEATAREYCRDARRDEIEEQKEQAWDMWLDCHSGRDIAVEILGDPEKESTIRGWMREFTTPLENRAPGATDKNPWGSVQHFDIWAFQNADKDAGSQSYFGALPPQVIENLLWFYTEPGQIVFDPFAGSGTTIDVAKEMGRRVWGSDRLGDKYSPHLPIHQHNIADGGWPEKAPKSADLVILDPPYWQQAKGRYSDDIDDLANCPLDVFYGAWSAIVKLCARRTKRIAYIISPTQQDDGSVIDHATDMLAPFAALGWRVERRIIVPYQTQQATGQQVEWARENKRMLKLYRDLVVLTK